MGRDKGLMEVGSEPWFMHVATLLQCVCEEVVVSLREEQLLSYQAAAPPRVRFITDVALEMGPMAGMLRCAECYPERNLMLFSCDLPFLKIAQPARLLSRSEIEDPWDAILFRVDGWAQPLAAIYNQRYLSRLRRDWSWGTLATHSILKLLKEASVLWVEADQKDRVALQNINTEREWLDLKI